MLAVGRQPAAVRTKPSAQLVVEAPCGTNVPPALTQIKMLCDAPAVVASVGAPTVPKYSAMSMCDELLNCQTLVTIALGWTIATSVATGVAAPKLVGRTTSSQPGGRLVVPATNTDPAVATQPLAVKTNPAGQVLNVCAGRQPAEVRTKPTGHPPIADTGTQPPLVKTKPTGQGPTWASTGRVPKEAEPKMPAVTRIASSNSLIGRAHESLMSASTASYVIE
jgi:hypothetical protein